MYAMNWIVCDEQMWIVVTTHKSKKGTKTKFIQKVINSSNSEVMEKLSVIINLNRIEMN